MSVCGFMQINTILGRAIYMKTLAVERRGIKKVPLAAPISFIWAWPDLLSRVSALQRWPDEISRMQKTETFAAESFGLRRQGQS